MIYVDFKIHDATITNKILQNHSNDLEWPLT